MEREGNIKQRVFHLLILLAALTVLFLSGEKRFFRLLHRLGQLGLSSMTLDSFT